MAIFSNYWKTRVVRIPALAIALAAALTTTGLNLLKPADWSGWVQALGACVGIAIAIYVPARQQKNAAVADERRRIDEARRVCMAFRDELGTLQKNIEGTNVRKLLATPEGGIFDRHISTSVNRFPIYTAYVGRITEIDNSAVRHGVIAAYEMIHALMEAGKLNNQLLVEYRVAYRRAEDNATEYNMDSVAHQEHALRDMCAQMKNLANLGIDRIGEALRLLDAEI